MIWHTGGDAPPQKVQDRRSNETFWHWPRDTTLNADAHRYGERNGVQVMERAWAEAWPGGAQARRCSERPQWSDERDLPRLNRV